MNSMKMLEESNRVRAAEKLIARLENIDYSLATMKEFTELCISSPNNVTWKPKISTDDIKGFVRQMYEEESACIKAELIALYPDDSQGQGA